MSQVRLIDPEQLPWRSVRAGVAASEATQADVEDGEPQDGRRCHRVHHEGTETDLDLFEVKMPPNNVIEVHAHEADEIVLVIEGELRLGARTLTVGCSALIPGWTLYGLTAGPDGARFLNFRGHKDRTFMSKEQFMQRRAERTAGR